MLQNKSETTQVYDVVLFRSRKSGVRDAARVAQLKSTKSLRKKMARARSRPVNEQVLPWRGGGGRVNYM